MNRAAIDLWVGLFVALGFSALVFLAVKVGSDSAVQKSDTYSLFVQFRDIGGLKARAPVKSAGVVVGRVRRIRLETTDDHMSLNIANVRIDIDKSYRFSTDTTASIRTSGLLGEQYIDLESGADDKMLDDKGTVTETQGALVLEKLIGQFFTSKASEPPAPSR